MRVVFQGDCYPSPSVILAWPRLWGGWFGEARVYAWVEDCFTYTLIYRLGRLDIRSLLVIEFNRVMFSCYSPHSVPCTGDYWKGGEGPRAGEKPDDGPKLAPRLPSQKHCSALSPPAVSSTEGARLVAHRKHTPAFKRLEVGCMSPPSPRPYWPSNEVDEAAAACKRSFLLLVSRKQL